MALPIRDADEGLPMPRRALAVVSITCGSVLYTLDGSIANVALPEIARQLGIAEASAVLIVSSYNLVLAMSLLPLAALGERLGHRRVFVAGMSLYLLASASCLLVQGLPLLLALRAMQALAAAALLSVSLGMVRLVYPMRMLGRGMGLNTMAASLGAAVAPPLGGLLLASAPWQTVFAAGLPLAFSGLAASRALPEPTPRHGAYDSRGAALCALTFGLVIAGLQSLAEGAPAWFAWPVLLGGLLAAVAFVRHERRIDHPVLPVDLLVRPALALSVAAAFLAVLASTILMLYLPFRLHMAGLDSAAIGAMIAPYAGTVMLAAPLAGLLSDRISPSLLGTIGMGLAASGLLAFVFLPTAPGFGAVAWRAALCGLGFSCFFSPNGRLVVGSVSRDRAAGASSLVSTTRMFGQALGSAAMAGLLALRPASSGPIVMAAVLALLGLGVSAARMAIPRHGS